jgi:hypothetical protein
MPSTNSFIPGEQPSAPCTPGAMRANEVEGRDIVCGDDGFWRECVRCGVIARGGKLWLTLDKSFIGVNLTLSARQFPVSHLFLVPCLGYVIRESPTERELEGEDEEALSCHSRAIEKTRPSR